MHSQRRAGAFLGYANIIVKNVVNLLYTPLLLAYVGQGDYGVFQTANSFVFSLSLLSFGLSGTYVRFYTQRMVRGDEEGIRKLNGMYLLLYSVICTLAMGIGLLASCNAAFIFGGRFTAGEVALAGRLMAVMTLNVAVTLFSTVFDANVVAHEEFAFQQTRQMLTTLATPGLALVLLRFGAGAVGVACAQLAVSLLLLALNVSYAVRRLGMRFDFRSPDVGLLVALVSFSAWLFANQVCDQVNQNVPNVVLGARCGSSAVAVFAVSVQIRNVFISLSTTLSSVFVPLVNQIVASSDGDGELTALMARVGHWQMMLLCWVYGGFAVVGRFFVLRWAGSAFSDAYVLVLVMVLPLMIPLSQNVGIEIQKARNLHKARSIVYLAMAALSVALTWVFSPRMGYWASALSYIASITLGNCLFMNWYYHARVGLDMVRYWTRILPVPACMALAISLCIVGEHLLPVSSWLTFIWWGGVYSVLYVAALWVAALSADERSALVSRLPRRAGHAK